MTDTTNSLDTRPCPFCGSRNLSCSHSWGTYIVCEDCGAYGPSGNEDLPADYTLDQVAEASGWNRRGPVVANA